MLADKTEETLRRILGTFDIPEDIGEAVSRYERIRHGLGLMGPADGVGLALIVSIIGGIAPKPVFKSKFDGVERATPLLIEEHGNVYQATFVQILRGSRAGQIEVAPFGDESMRRPVLEENARLAKVDKSVPVAPEGGEGPRPLAGVLEEIEAAKEADQIRLAAEVLEDAPGPESAGDSVDGQIVTKELSDEIIQAQADAAVAKFKGTEVGTAVEFLNDSGCFPGVYQGLGENGMVLIGRGKNGRVTVEVPFDAVIIKQEETVEA